MNIKHLSWNEHIAKKKQSHSFTEESAGFDCGQIRLWKNNTFAESSSSARLVGLFKIVSFW